MRSEQPPANRLAAHIAELPKRPPPANPIEHIASEVLQYETSNVAQPGS